MNTPDILLTIAIPGAALAGDGAAARRAPLGEQLTEAVRAVGRVLARRELLSRELHLAPRAHETFLQTNITYIIYNTKYLR